MFAPQEVFTGPDCQTGRDESGIDCLNTTPGPYDLAEVAKGLNVTPDIVVIKPDATGRNVPRNLNAVPGIKVLVLGDTHHMDRPIAWMLDYAASEPFDVMICHHARQHVHFFAHAGLKAPCYWIPLLSVNPHPQPPAAKPTYPISFVGSMGPWHPYRTLVLDALKAAGLTLHLATSSQEGASDIYARSRISLNVSLNGDINHRVGEVMAAGGLLLTDRLSKESGLAALFEDGQHLVCYDDIDDLIDKARHYLTHPDEASAIRRAGTQRFFADHHPDRKRDQFLDLVLNGKAADGWDLSNDPRHRFAVPAGPIELLKRVEVYEAVQELHRRSAHPRLLLAPGIDPAHASDGADLKRLQIRLGVADYAQALSASDLFRQTQTSDRISTVPAQILLTQASADTLLLAGNDLPHLPELPGQIAFPDSLLTPLSPHTAERMEKLGYRKTGRILWQRKDAQ
jgi:hypothetical protein